MTAPHEEVPWYVPRFLREPQQQRVVPKSDNPPFVRMTFSERDFELIPAHQRELERLRRVFSSSADVHP